MLGLEQPSGDSAAVVDTAPVDSNADAVEIVDDLPDGDLPENGEATPEEEEDEIDGVKLRGKKEALEKLKAERSMHADYTRKTQEVAEQRKSFEAREQQFQQTAQSHEQHIREVATLVTIDDRLAQFANFDFNAAADQDPVQTLKLHNEFTQLQAKRAQVLNSITQKQQSQQQEMQRSNAKQILDARQVLERDIKGWSPELANKLAEYGKAEGYESKVLDNVTSATFIKTLNKAFKWDQYEKQQRAKAPATPAAPVTRLSGASAVSTKNPAQMTDAEFAVFRRRQIAQRR